MPLSRSDPRDKLTSTWSKVILVRRGFTFGLPRIGVCIGVRVGAMVGGEWPTPMNAESEVAIEVVVPKESSLCTLDAARLGVLLALDSLDG